MVKRVLGLLGWLGVALQPLTPDLAASFGAEGQKGALISDVTADSPAAKAGLKSGDVLLEVDGHKVENPSDVARAIAFVAPGRTAKLGVWRDNARTSIDIVLGEMPDERRASRLGFDVRRR